MIEAQEKVFRSSSSFINPEKAEVSEASRRLSGLLKGNILAREFQDRKRNQMLQKDNDIEREKMISNYRYFGGIR